MQVLIVSEIISVCAWYSIIWRSCVWDMPLSMFAFQGPLLGEVVTKTLSMSLIFSHDSKVVSPLEGGGGGG